MRLLGALLCSAALTVPASASDEAPLEPYSEPISNWSDDETVVVRCAGVYAGMATLIHLGKRDGVLGTLAESVDIEYAKTAQMVGGFRMVFPDPVTDETIAHVTHNPDTILDEFKSGLQRIVQASIRYGVNYRDERSAIQANDHDGSVMLKDFANCAREISKMNAYFYETVEALQPVLNPDDPLKRFRETLSE
ncbi:MAG: hypothetical protein AAF557_09940 [Pseudomonadota bacterium]